jgi:hypothetical protein
VDPGEDAHKTSNKLGGSPEAAGALKPEHDKDSCAKESDDAWFAPAGRFQRKGTTIRMKSYIVYELRGVRLAPSSSGTDGA